MRGFSLWWISLAFAAELVGIAHAQTESAASDLNEQSDSARAEELFREGRQASARGDHQAACQSYRESFRIESALGTLLNIAVCEEALGQLRSAFEHYQRVLPALPEGDSRVALTRDRLQALERRLPRVTILLMEGDRDTTRILIGSIEHSIASLSGPLVVDPGEHELRVLAKGREPRSYSFAIAEGERRTLAIEPGEPIALPSEAAGGEREQIAPLAVAQREQPADSSVGVRRAFGWAALVVGGAGLATSAVAFGLVIDRKITVDDHCPNRVCDDIGDDASRSGRVLTYVSAISLAGGVLATATGLYLLWIAPDETASSAQARVAPLVDRNLLGAELTGTF